MERKPGGAGGGKRPYEATFRIAMKIGRKYPSTAAQLIPLSTNIRPILLLSVSNTLAYYSTELNMACKKVLLCRFQEAKS